MCVYLELYAGFPADSNDTSMLVNFLILESVFLSTWPLVVLLTIDRRGGQYELLDWLSNVTFPKEAEFADLDFAKEVYYDVVRRSLDCGVRGLNLKMTPDLNFPSDNDFVLLFYSPPGS